LGFNHALALNDQKQLFVWGKKMGIYPQFEMNYHGIKAATHIQTMDVQQDYPRLIKSNLIFYKIKKICTGPSTSALITENGELLISG